MSIGLYMRACEERFATDLEYRARLQKELFNTDASRSIQRTLEATRFEQSIRRTA